MIWRSIPVNHQRVLRGTTERPRFSPAIADALTTHYGFNSPIHAEELGGSSNLNIMVTGASGRFVARVYRHWVTPGRLDAIQRARQALNEGGVPSPPPVPTLDGKDWCVAEGLLAEVERFVDRDADMDSWETLQRGLPWLGRVHSLLRAVEVSSDGRNAPASNSIDAATALELTLAGTERVRAWSPTDEQTRLADQADELAHLTNELGRASARSRPRQMVHGDFWDNNVFFQGGRVVLVTDLDFMGERARIDDLALTLYYTNSTFDDDQTSRRRADRLRKLIDAYDDGLDENLSQAERVALPLALARTPLAFIAMIADIDLDEAAKRHADGMAQDVQWGLAIAKQLQLWQEAFA